METWANIPRMQLTANDAGKGDSNERPPKHPPWRVFLVFLASAVVILALFGWSVHSATALLAELLVASAATSVGSLLGFLFGMPRAPLQSESRDPSAIEKPSAYRPSNNLEQVSDWLTKILIGVGLVQLVKLSDALQAIGAAVATSLKDPPAGTNVVTQVVVISFLVFGFLASFLWTRIYYGPLHAIADRDVYKELEEAKHEALIQKESKERAVKIASGIAQGEITTPATVASPEDETKKSRAQSDTAEWDEDVLKKLEEFKNSPEDWNEDTSVKVFGKAPSEANGRILEADFLMDLEEAAVIQLRVRSLTGQPLEAPVMFVLHPSFTKSVFEVQPKGDRAETTITAGEWFTVVAILDNGKTVLSYNLRKLAGAPNWFK